MLRYLCLSNSIVLTYNAFPYLLTDFVNNTNGGLCIERGTDVEDWLDKGMVGIYTLVWLS